MMTSMQARLSWAAVGMVFSYNVLGWLPASIWAFIIAASTGMIFLFATRPVMLALVVAAASFSASMLTARFVLPYYGYYLAFLWTVFVLSPAGIIAAGIRRGMSAYRVQLLAILPAAVITMLYLADIGGISSFWKSLLDGASSSVTDWFREASRSLPSSPSPEEMKLLKDGTESMFGLLYRFSAGLFIFWAAAMNIAAYYFACMMIRKNQGFCRGLKEFVLWKLGFTAMILLAVALLLRVIGVEKIMPFTDNLLFVLGVSYMVAGFAVIEYYLRLKRMHAAVRILIYLVFILSGWAGGLFAALVGIVDSHFDFRRVRAQQIG